MGLLINRIDSAVVLAGGPGTRLKPLTNNLPKSMIKIRGKPLLEWIIKWLGENEIKNVVLGVAYEKDKVMEYFGDGSKFGIKIKYSVHTVEGGTGEGFRLAIGRHIDQEVFYAMNGDQITDLRLKDLGDFHASHNPLATIAVTSPPCPYGNVKTNKEHDIVDFTEKPPCPRMVCSTGIYVFNRDILSHLPVAGDIEKTTFPELAKSRQLKAYQFSGFFVTVNTSKDLCEAEHELMRIRK